MLKTIVLARAGICHRLIQKGRMRRSMRWQVETWFGWEGGRVQRVRAGTGRMVGLQLTRDSPTMTAHPTLVVWGQGMYTGFLMNAQDPFLSSVPPTLTGSQEIMQWFWERICSEVIIAKSIEIISFFSPEDWEWTRGNPDAGFRKWFLNAYAHHI